MKYLYLLLILFGIICPTDLKCAPLELPETYYSLLSTTSQDKKPIEINIDFVIDGDNSKLEIGIICNQTLGKQTLYANLMKYDFKNNIGGDNWLEDYIKTSWDPSKAYLSFPTKEGITIDCKEGAVYHFEYKFKWAWETTYNSIIALVYIQNLESKNVLAVERSNNILFSEFRPLIPSTNLTIKT